MTKQVQVDASTGILASSSAFIETVWHFTSICANGLSNVQLIALSHSRCMKSKWMKRVELVLNTWIRRDRSVSSFTSIFSVVNFHFSPFLLLPNISLYKFLSILPNWKHFKHFTVNEHMPPTYLLLLIFYYFHFKLTYPSLSQASNLFFLCS